MENKIEDIFSWDGYNNIGIGSIAIASVLNYRKVLSVPKALLVIPMITHTPTLSYMSSKSTLNRSSAALTSGFPNLFTNFNERFEDSLPLSLNSIQYLVHLGYAKFDQNLIFLKKLEIDNEFGTRAEKIFIASKKISQLLNDDSEELFLNLRIKL
ncbi:MULTISPECIES: three component ABC system middle component [Rahnella]|uniref:Uncharacterized protein n=1 Tax=Rahnella laticis TaxID=2787622 RepID=A0ABS0E0C9_9GAMM|nr:MULTISPECIES: three component ABC system middle component [Rahnella]MBF7978562.1 hypothetical protein [Rahnella laticis]MBF7998652.1 hypothetical protein [Rahnella sp. LAC-M12]